MVNKLSFKNKSYGVPIVVFLALMRRFGYDLESVERDILIVMMECWSES